jgi:serine/threonine protein kinase
VVDLIDFLYEKDGREKEEGEERELILKKEKERENEKEKWKELENEMKDKEKIKPKAEINRIISSALNLQTSPQPIAPSLSNSSVYKSSYINSNSPISSSPSTLSPFFLIFSSLYHIQPNIYPTPSGIKVILNQISHGIYHLHYGNSDDVIDGTSCNSTNKQHISIIHRDIKPTNILFDPHGIGFFLTDKIKMLLIS